MNKKIDNLLEKRGKLRKDKKFAEADILRKQIESMGYAVTDRMKQSVANPTERPRGAEESFIVLFGSGEISSIGRGIHDFVLNKIHKTDIKIAIVSTPAGFQPNVVTVCEEIAEFFRKSLSNYHPSIAIIYANSSDLANYNQILADLDSADYIFMGPGSPTYARKNLANTLLLSKIKEAVKNGKSLCLSSAAVLAFSKFTLPVYEIYKAGLDLYWEKGLDLLSSYMEYTTAIPHKNNNEGGEKLDTSYCYMGRVRFKKLRQKLAKGEKIIGIDEQTALVIDLKNKSQRVMGKGKIHEL